MTAPSALTNLIALLLALKQLKIHPSPDRLEQIYELGEKLKLDPSYCQSISQDLDAIMAGDLPLQSHFQFFLSRLTALGELPLDIWPEIAELQAELGASNQVEFRGFRPNQNSPSVNLEIINDIVVPTLLSNNILAQVEKLSFLQRIQQRIAESAGDGSSPFSGIN